MPGMRFIYSSFRLIRERMNFDWSALFVCIASLVEGTGLIYEVMNASSYRFASACSYSASWNLLKNHKFSDEKVASDMGKVESCLC